MKSQAQATDGHRLNYVGISHALIYQTCREKIFCFQIRQNEEQQAQAHTYQIRQNEEQQAQAHTYPTHPQKTPTPRKGTI